MFRIKPILKSTLKHKALTGLNLFNLTITFTGIIILTLYVTFEKSYDTFHKDADQIYRLETEAYRSNVAAPFCEPIRKNIPEVEEIALIKFDYGRLATEELKSQNTYIPSDVIATDSSFFEIFTLNVVLGNKVTPLSDPNTIVLTESLKNKLFGNKNPIGESVSMGRDLFTVGSVIKDFPTNSSIQTDAIINIKSSSGSRYYLGWSEWSYTIFLKLRKGVNHEEIAKKMSLLDEVVANNQEIVGESKVEQFVKLIPFNKVHFLTYDPKYRFTNPYLINTLIILVVVLFVMGAFNYVNFYTSQAPLKSKTLAIYQILGGKRLGSIGNVIVESLLLTLAAFIIAFGIYLIFYSMLENIFEVKGLSIWDRFYYVGWFLIGAILFGLITAIYPALYVTSPKLVESVKGNAYFKNKGKFLRDSIVVFQFILTITLLSSAFFIEKQLNYWSNFDMGINKEHVVHLKISNKLEQKRNAFANELVKNNGILDYTYAQFVPGSVYMGWGRNINGKRVQLKAWPVDDRFMNFFDINILEGRKFTEGSNADLNTFIVNKKAVDKYEWDRPFDITIPAINASGNIIGITDNFNFASLKDEVGPLVFWRTDTRMDNLMLRIKTDNYNQLFAHITQVAKSFDPKYDINIKFLDDSLNKLYKKEQNMARFVEFVAFWCMLLALTGISGLIFFITRDKVKEIGIRKVNGAETMEILQLLNVSLVKWIVIAFILACPITYFVVSLWLENYAYKTDLSWWVFATSGFISLAISMLIASIQSWQAATRNPVEALRCE